MKYLKAIENFNPKFKEPKYTSGPNIGLDIRDRHGVKMIDNMISKKQGVIDGDNILWKYVNDQWVGKRYVMTTKHRHIWLSELRPGEEIKSWVSGENADYEEVFNDN